MKFMARKLKPRATGAFFISLIIFFACSLGTSVSDKEKESFVKAYVELSLIQLKYKNKAGNYERIEENILTENNFTKEEFANFGEKISANPKLQMEIYQEIKTRLETYQELPADSLSRIIKNLSLNDKEKFK